MTPAALAAWLREAAEWVEALPSDLDLAESISTDYRRRFAAYSDPQSFCRAFAGEGCQRAHHNGRVILSVDVGPGTISTLLERDPIAEPTSDTVPAPRGEP